MQGKVRGYANQAGGAVMKQADIKRVTAKKA
jgi:hypothetical protein